MVYLKWLALMPASFIMAIVGRLLAPVLPFFVDKETHRLPKWLDWFATDDNDADGDEGHWQRCCCGRGRTSVLPQRQVPDGAHGAQPLS